MTASFIAITEVVTLAPMIKKMFLCLFILICKRSIPAIVNVRIVELNDYIYWVFCSLKLSDYQLIWNICKAMIEIVSRTLLNKKWRRTISLWFDICIIMRYHPLKKSLKSEKRWKKHNFTSATTNKLPEKKTVSTCLAISAHQ